MCELLAISARQPTSVTFSLERFAERGGLNGKTLDGWGLAYYDGCDVHLFREPEPARASPWLAFIASRRTPSWLVLSHIRHATRGAISLANTQPFAREIGGAMHCFAHNGMLPGIEDEAALRSSRFRPIGDTDSEIAACALLDRMATLWESAQAPCVADRLACVGEVASILRSLGPANFLYSDGEILFAHGHRRIQGNGRIEPPGLWMLTRTCDVDPEVLASAGVALRPADEHQEIILIASVPLTAEAWRPLEEGEIVAVRAGQVIAGVSGSV